MYARTTPSGECSTACGGCSTAACGGCCTARGGYFFPQTSDVVGKWIHLTEENLIILCQNMACNIYEADAHQKIELQAHVSWVHKSIY